MHSKGTIIKVKRQPTEWEKIISNEITDKKDYFPKCIRSIIQFSSIAQSCPTLCDPRTWTNQGFLLHLLKKKNIYIYIYVYLLLLFQIWINILLQPRYTFHHYDALDCSNLECCLFSTFIQISLLSSQLKIINKQLFLSLTSYP